MHPVGDADRLAMSLIESLIQTIAQAGWDAFQAAGQQMMNSAISFICEMVMVAMVFVILFGMLFYFTNYNGHGKGMIVNGVIGIIVATCIYMWLLGASGPPDISLWFKPPT